jgi:hypothetical protein
VFPQLIIRWRAASITASRAPISSSAPRGEFAAVSIPFTALAPLLAENDNEV